MLSYTSFLKLGVIFQAWVLNRVSTFFLPHPTLGGTHLSEIFRSTPEKKRKLSVRRELALCKLEFIERLRFTFTPNGRREFVPRDQVSPLFSVYSLLLLHKNK